MNLSERQRGILENVVAEYVKKAIPISSQLLEEEYDLGFSPATIRNELQILTEKGYLFQPHISAGRIPTDKGYRLFVDEVLEEMPRTFQEMRIADYFSLTQELSKSFSGLVVTYTSQNQMFWKEGWEDLLLEPEFQEGNSIKNLTQFLRDIEENIEQVKAEQYIDIYIGRENPFSKVKDFSMIFSALSGDSEGIVALIGPKRMAYDKNINILQEILYPRSENSK